MKYYLRFDRIFVALGGRWTIAELLSTFFYLFLLAHCSLPRPVSAKDPERERALYNGFSTISSKAQSSRDGTALSSQIRIWANISSQVHVCPLEDDLSSLKLFTPQACSVHKFALERA